MDSRRHQDTNFSQTEEAFLLRSLKEVVNVWARGHGQASLNLSVKNGFAELNLGFQLGHPADPHYLPTHDPPVHPEPVPQQPKQPRRRGPGRCERDRARAAKHQASHNHKESVSDEVVSDVILPFSGKILPITAALEPPVSKPPLPSLSSASTKTPTTACSCSSFKTNTCFTSSWCSTN
jgi:hypothetical protein